MTTQELIDQKKLDADVAAYMGTHVVSDPLPLSALNELRGPEERLRPLVPILREYTQKLRELRPSGATAKHAPPVQVFLTTARRFAQFVSQRLDRAQDEVLRMELELRLAEYEMELLRAQGS